MNQSADTSSEGPRYELCFGPLNVNGRGYVFPCDEVGHVDMNRLSERGRNNYLYARVVVGHDLSCPVVAPVAVEA